MAERATSERRPIRSYVLREGRMTDAQRQAFDRLWHRYGVDYVPGAPLPIAQSFGNTRPVCLEIGFGNGEALAARAARQPEFNHLGIEVHRPGVGHLLLQVEKAALDNVRVIRADAAEILRHALPAHSLEGIYLLFPDPWPKKKHHKRRMVQADMLASFARVLRPGGFVHMATDWRDYAEHMLSCLEASAQFRNTAPRGGFAPRPDDRPLTRFEQRGLRLGHEVWDLLFIHQPESTG